MPNQELAELKNQIKAAIRRNSDRGFVSYSGCNSICVEMMHIVLAASECVTAADRRHAFDIYIMVLQEAVKLISHADTSSGAAGDVIDMCLTEIDKLCQAAEEVNHKHFFDSIIKTAKNKAFTEWPDYGYGLLKSAVYFVRDTRQADKIYDLFPAFGIMYGGKDYPDKLLITHRIIESLEGKEAADKYLMANIQVPELRIVAVENALASKHYLVAEKLCVEAIQENTRGYFNKPAPWAYYLERLYIETAKPEKLLETVRFILFHGNTAYYKKLKELYEQQNVWEQKREPLLQDLSKALMTHEYATLLAQEGEVHGLLAVTKQHKSYIVNYGKLLAGSLPAEAYGIYEQYILEEAKGATDRRKYKGVCGIIKNFSAAGAKTRASEIIDRLSEMYQRRPAMLEELAGLKKKLSK